MLFWNLVQFLYRLSDAQLVTVASSIRSMLLHRVNQLPQIRGNCYSGIINKEYVAILYITTGNQRMEMAHGMETPSRSSRIK